MLLHPPDERFLWNDDPITDPQREKMIDLDKAAIGDTVTINGYKAVLTERSFL